MPTLEPVGRDNAPEAKYEPVRIPVIGHTVADGEEVQETFEFRPTVNMGAALALIRRQRNEGAITFDSVLAYLESSMTPPNFEAFMTFLQRPDIEVHAQTIVDVQRLLAAEYLKDRPTVARSSSGRGKPKQTSAAGSGGKGRASTSSPSR
jgi:hypothetical protein